jgi:hypothetical protein
MATLASVLSKYFARAVERADAPVHSGDTSTRLRNFANEDIYFYVKRIDNSRVARENDPGASQVQFKMIGSAVVAVGLLLFVLMPSAYSLLAGYQVEELRQERTRLLGERAELELDEAALLSPARMQELARMQKFVDPEPATVVYLNAPGDAEFAKATK